jgi:chaperonin cofactor prefoldin
VLFLIASFTFSIVLGCGGRQRRQTKSLENRINSLEKNMETMNKNMGTMKKVMDRVDSIDKRVTTLEQRAYDLEKSKTGVIAPVPVETDSQEKEE